VIVSEDLTTPATDSVSPPSPAPTEAPPPRANLLREIIETVLLTAVIFLLVNTATGRFRIEGQSMEPNLHDNEYVLIDKISYLLHPPERGDVIVLLRPSERDYIKRVIGLPGDTIEVRARQVIVNGVPLTEPYIPDPPNYTYGPIMVEPDRYFVLGDNRNNSSDSHSFGTVAAKDIVGRAWLVYWPPSAWGAVPHYSYAAVARK
jgi:signal peptidase I